MEILAIVSRNIIFKIFDWRGQDWIEIELESGDMSTLDFFALLSSCSLPLDFPGVVIFLNTDLIEGLDYFFLSFFFLFILNLSPV